MFPEAQDCPAGSLEYVIGVGVPLLVAFDSLSPVVGVGFRRYEVFGTAVPKATIDEDSDLRLREDDVGVTPDSAIGEDISAVPQAACMKQSANREFGFGVPALICLNGRAGMEVCSSGVSLKAC